VLCSIAMLAEVQQNRFLNSASRSHANGWDRPCIEQLDYDLSAIPTSAVWRRKTLFRWCLEGIWGSEHKGENVF
jgi:hypothetical protein